LIQAAEPELVRDEVRQNLLPLEIDLAQKIKAGVTTFREAGSEQAYFGDPAAATAEEGQPTYEALAAMLVTAILESREANVQREKPSGSSPHCTEETAAQ
jgi:creatinine amidohydrolase